ncbi:MAG UNVERIFIED_CONTAM: hypothetical protein LVQ98_06130 [Rickettsiaceae bacterium]|jgi:hypothetical protein
MQKLDMVGIDNHLIEKLNMREQLIQNGRYGANAQVSVASLLAVDIKQNIIWFRSWLCF